MIFVSTETILNNYSALLLPKEQRFNLVMTKPVLHNKQAAILYRYEPNEAISLNQENVSCCFRKSGFVLI